MTEEILITLIENHKGDMYLIHNALHITDVIPSEPPATSTVPPADQTAPSASQTETLTDQVIDSYLNRTHDVTPVNDVAQLPVIESVDSTIFKLEQMSDLKLCLTRKERKLIGLRDIEHWKLKQQQDEFTQFIHLISDDEYIKQLRRHIDHVGETLNLTHNYTLRPDLLQKVGLCSKVTQLIIYQNFQINDFQWLANFPNIRLINIFYAHQMEQSHFQQIVDCLPDLEVCNIHYCTRINLRVLIPLLKLRHLEKLAIEDAQFWCQKGVHELFVLPTEWKSIYCPSLQKVAINSTNLTLDVIDYLLTACPNIQHLIVDDDVLKSVSENIEAGTDPDLMLSVSSWQNPQKGFMIHQKVHFKNLLRNNYSSQMFSDSMLRKIKELRAQRGEKEQTAIVDSPH